MLLCRLLRRSEEERVCVRFWPVLLRVAARAPSAGPTALRPGSLPLRLLRPRREHRPHLSTPEPWQIANHSLIFLSRNDTITERYNLTKSVKARLSPREPIPAWPAHGYHPSGSPSGSCRPHRREIRRAARCLYLPRPPWDAALRTAGSSQPWDRREMEIYTLGTGRASVTRRANPRLLPRLQRHADETRSGAARNPATRSCRTVTSTLDRKRARVRDDPSKDRRMRLVLQRIHEHERRRLPADA